MRMSHHVLGMTLHRHTLYANITKFAWATSQRMTTRNSHYVSVRHRVKAGLEISATHGRVSLHPIQMLLGREFRRRFLVSTKHYIATLKPSEGGILGVVRSLGLFTFFGLWLSLSVVRVAYAKAPFDNRDKIMARATGSSHSDHGKKVHRDYSVIGIPGDGRCLFRSVAHGACIRSGEPIPNEDLQRQLADELRAMVADELVKRRTETEWFIEGDFDAYVSRIRRPHEWGGEPELLMASHVLQMPITVYMHNEEASGLIAIAEYGQEYGKEDPIRVLYHGFGHYDALVIPTTSKPTRL